ncbi:N-acetyllactosaminide beta-1,3-N-acetylglucosaminyltransferase 2 [Syngnathoides biaculeatus]|uniref:N-acetyllactosaminide beta-1,3-N-acetylglucosaminyltransferase 2 n=1 Tax=Syngnathoides biaculeatus TaxID=300417 RepID=UPI002ADDCF0B|nr:N-acetyllactosaminide beta-1,3-N-acetylglucosaminyltransferase 2 [Syngnathoides biaculeatus]XP_061683378.1 N-acetyllactosaminide beta-1,3-N-acetylglucosaminyltransferase 2 [Syngnathoides biaculeatus]
MRLIQRFRAMLLLSALFLLFLFSAVRKDVVSGAEGALKHSWLRQTGIRTQVPTSPNINVSYRFRTSIPENGAYWNRLLHSGLKRADKGKDQPWHHCRETNQELMDTNVHNLASYPLLLQNFLRGMKCRSPPLLVDQPGKCEENATFLLFAIKSIPANFERRQAVRDSWGRERLHDAGQRVRTVFMLGTASPDDPDLSALVQFEAERYGDIVQADFYESLFNLTLKMNAFLQWTLERCSRVSFVFSGDDDVVVNTPALLGYLLSLDSSKASRLYAGHVIKNASPLRDPKSKYFIPMSFYEGPYPTYVGGAGFVFSGALLAPLYSISGIIPFFPIDDVYTGMCFSALGVSPEAHAGFQTFDIRERDRENLCAYKKLILVHRRSPQQLKRIWRGIHSPLLTC